MGRARPSLSLAASWTKSSTSTRPISYPQRTDSVLKCNSRASLSLAVGDECLQSRFWQHILCCDGPNFRKKETKLKQVRLPIEKAVEFHDEQD